MYFTLKLTPERRLNRESMKSKMGAALIIEFNLKKPCAQTPLVNYTQNSCKNIFLQSKSHILFKKIVDFKLKVVERIKHNKD